MIVKLNSSTDILSKKEEVYKLKLGNADLRELLGKYKS